jgi:hypothetical protein
MCCKNNALTKAVPPKSYMVDPVTLHPAAPNTANPA